MDSWKEEEVVRYCVTISALVLCVVMVQASARAEEWSWQQVATGTTDVQALFVETTAPGVLYAGSRGSVLKSGDYGLSWREVLHVGGNAVVVNCLHQEAGDGGRLYAATTHGLFSSPDRGASWRRVFRGRGSNERNVIVIATAEGAVYVGTAGGLFISSDRGRSWRRASGTVGSAPVYEVVVDCHLKLRVWAASAAGLFRSDDAGARWMKFGSVLLRSEAQGLPNEDSDESTPEEGSAQSVCVDPLRPHVVYAGSSGRVSVSYDDGGRWQRVPQEGLLGREVVCMRASPSMGLFVVTDKGLFAFDGERWQESSLRLVAARVHTIAIDSQNTLFAATAQGLYRGKRERGGTAQVRGVLSWYTQGLPSIRRVQEEAIAYAEVHPDKIRKWRQAAANRAWLPEVSVGVNRDVTDLWHWESGSTTKSDDDTLVRGRDALGWDLRLSWDVGGLIWSDDQTSIDVRSRLTTELRADILDEVTKLYYERIRVAMELDHLPLEERKRRMEKELRLQELAASLDALTDGYFSSHFSRVD